MFRSLLVVVLLFPLGLLGKPGPSDILKPARYNAVLISPGGEYLAVVQSTGDDTWFTIYNTDDRKSVFNSNMGDKVTIASIHWVSDRYLIVAPARKAFGDAKGLTGELFSIDAKKGKIRRLNEKDCERCGGVMVHPLYDQPEKILVSGSFDQYTEVKVVDIKNNTRYRLHRAPRPYARLVPNSQGEVVFAIGDSPDNRTEVYKRKGSDWELIHSYAFGEPGWYPAANGPTPDTFFTYDSRGGSTVGFGLYNTTTDEHKMLVRFDEVDVSRMYRDYNYQVYAVRTDLHYPAIHYLSQRYPLARIRQSLQKSFPNQTIAFTSVTRDHMKVIAYVSGDRQPGQYVLVDLEAKRVEKLFDARPDLKPEELAPMHPLEIQARDGEKIYAYLSEAPGVPKPGPLILNLHGGPHGARDFWGYNSETQLLASLGAHVLQVNFRGSGGYGIDYESAGYRKWGTLMQDDVTDATQWAISNKIADPERICIYGSSYGAYSALMGAAREPDMYQCAIGFVGVYDLAMLASHGDIRQRKAGLAYLRRVIGTDPEDLKSRSPVNLAHRIKADVMLIAGGMDRRAPISHSRRMRAALERHGKEVRWLTEIQQGHGFAGVSDQLKLYRGMADFMAPHLKLNLAGISWEKQVDEDAVSSAD